MICSECRQFYNGATEDSTCPHPEVVTTTDKLSDRELDALVAERVMGLTLAVCRFVYDGDGPCGNDYAFRDGLAVPCNCIAAGANHGRAISDYSTEIADAMLVEDRIAELGLQEEYAAALIQALSPDSISNPGSVFHLPVWLLIHATPRQRCDAALAAIEAVKEK